MPSFLPLKVAKNTSLNLFFFYSLDFLSYILKLLAKSDQTESLSCYGIVGVRLEGRQSTPVSSTIYL